MKFLKNTRTAWNRSLPGAVVSDVVDGVEVVGRKVDDLTDPVTEPVSRQIKKVTTKVSAKVEERRILRQIAKAQAADNKAAAEKKATA